MSDPTPESLAEDALRAAYETQYQGQPAVVLRSPPGAGKTGVAQRLALLNAAMLSQRCMVVTQTNEQAFELTHRLAGNKAGLPIHFFAREGLVIPERVLAAPAVRVIHRAADLPREAGITVSNAAKWSWIEGGEGLFDVQIIDEAYQLPDYRYHLISNLAARHVLIGDPGQIDPFVTCETERWRCDPAGPQIACPTALIRRHPDVVQLNLPVSRRLNADTVRIVQPAFYPGMPFRALNQKRELTFGVAGILPFDAALDAVAGGASIVHVELPNQVTGEMDGDLADELVYAVERFLRRRQAVMVEGDIACEVSPEHVGVVCAHVSQVNAVRERLGPDLSGVFVETANRFQGIERPFMFVHHPLSGRADATGFHLDAGRLCVMLSRHRIGCWIFGRQGIADQLNRFVPAGDRALGIDDDPEFQGWRAHATLLSALARSGRIFEGVHDMDPDRDARFTA